VAGEYEQIYSIESLKSSTNLNIYIVVTFCSMG